MDMDNFHWRLSKKMLMQEGAPNIDAVILLAGCLQPECSHEV